MKKKLSAFLALLLMISMLLVSCGSDGKGGLKYPGLPPDDPDGGKTPDILESEANAAYASAIAEWVKYIDFNAVEESEENEIRYSLVGGSSVSAYASFFGESDSGNLAYFQLMKFVTEKGSDGVEYHGKEITVYVYNVGLGKFVLTKTGFTPYGKGMGPHLIQSPDYNYARTVENSIDFLAGGAITRLTTVSTVLRELSEQEIENGVTLDPKDQSNYVTKTEYSYYDENGVLLSSGSNLTAYIRGDYADIGEYTYAFDAESGDILCRYPLGLELPLPDFEMNDSRYAYFTVGKNHYTVLEEQLQLVPIGDLALMTLPGIKLQILDEQYKIVNEYVTDSYSVLGYTVLPNGDFYVCEYEQVPEASETYDVLISGVKMNVKHTVISATVAGKKTELDRSFTAQKLYTEPMYGVNTPFISATKGDFAGFCALKDGYMLANLQKFENGVLGADTVIAVLDSDLNIVAELPKILPNQFGYASYLDEDQLVVMSAARLTEYGTTLLYYTASTKNGDVELYFRRESDGSFGSAERLNGGGYWYRGSVYDCEWNELYDVSSDYLSDYRVISGKLAYISSSGYCYVGEIVKRNEYEDSGTTYGTYESDYVFVLEPLLDESGVTHDGNHFAVTRGNTKYIYDINGKQVFSFVVSETVTVRDAENPEYYAVYEITREHHRYAFREGGPFISLVESTVLTESTYPPEYNISSGDNYDSYYIIK